MKLSRRQQRWLVRPLALFMMLLGKSWRVRRQGFPAARAERQFIDAIEHGHMLYFLNLYRGQPAVTLVSEHRDGEMIAEIVERFGGLTARGSSTRGGARAYLTMLKQYGDRGWVVTPDGPRGPKGSVHEGIIKMASDTGRAIRPHGFAASTAKRFQSWDRFTVPLPFARVVQFVGDPLHVPPKADRATRQQLAKDLERRLREANQEAEAALARLSHRTHGDLQQDRDGAAAE